MVGADDVAHQVTDSRPIWPLPFRPLLGFWNYMGGDDEEPLVLIQFFGETRHVRHGGSLELFVILYPVEEHDRFANRHLREQLDEERSGILAWMVRGCLRWQERGLDPPLIVKQAVRSYRRDEDLLGSFIEERCFIDSLAEVKATELYSVFSDWWESNIAKKTPKQRRFGQMMAKRFKKEKKGTYTYFGIGLLASE